MCPLPISGVWARAGPRCSGWRVEVLPDTAGPQSPWGWWLPWGGRLSKPRLQCRTRAAAHWKWAVHPRGDEVAGEAQGGGAGPRQLEGRPPTPAPAEPAGERPPVQGRGRDIGGPWQGQQEQGPPVLPPGADPGPWGGPVQTDDHQTASCCATCSLLAATGCVLVGDRSPQGRNDTEGGCRKTV